MTYEEAKQLVAECGLNIEGEKHKEVLNLVLEALDKQIEKKPIRKNHNIYNCPCCDMGVIREEYSWSSEETTIFHEDFCEWCGQAIDWSK